MKRSLPFLMALCVLLSVITVSPVWAIEEETPTFQTSTPTWLFDFTTDELHSSFSNCTNMSYQLTDGEYTTFTATDDDPYTWIKTPTCSTGEAAFAVSCYRTSAANRAGEFFCQRTDGVQMGQAGSNQQWILDSSGNWTTQVIQCTAWNSVDVDFSVFRIDPLQGIGEKVAAGDSIDIQYIAFFSTETDANAFDFDEYQRMLAWNAEKENAAKDVLWPDPVFVEQETVANDTNAGTLRYTPSADGQKMTISYEAGGNTYEYTVPNNQNYISGGYAGVDDLDRSLYTSDDVGAYKGDERYVGLFYFLWQGEHGDSGIYNLQKIIDELGVDGANNIDCGAYGEANAMHFFAEPLYGYYYANDAWVMRKHVELLTNANIDFLYFDVTNGYPYLNNALQMMKILHEFNEAGYDAPQVVFYTHTNADSVVQQLYTSIYGANRYPDTWFRIGGKPVIVAPDSIQINDTTHITDVFTVKCDQWPNDPNINTNAWPWMDFEWPQRVFADETGKPSAISVSIAQHSGTVRFSDSSLYLNATNRGRSYVNEEGYTSKDARYSSTLSKSYRAWKNDPSLTMYGLNFQAQFDYAIESEAEFILVTGWNEWVAQRQYSDDGSVIFVDTASMEFSRDAEMMRGGYFDNYYMQLIFNVQRVKGTAPVIVQDARQPINVTGNFDQWDDVVVTYSDPSGDTVDRNAQGFGHQTLTNTTGRNDIVSAKVTGDTKNLYFYAQTANDISMFDKNSSWMQLYVNADADASTGWYGYDYIVNYKAEDTFTTTVAQYNGQDNSFSFKKIGEVSYRVKDNEIMIAVPLELLGIENYYAVELEFKWADSTTTYNEMEDFYCDGDAAPLGRLNYVYQNYIEGVSVPPVEETEPETTPSIESTPIVESEADTTDEAVSDSETETEADATETEATSGGCASVAAVPAAILATAIAAAFLLRKRD